MRQRTINFNAALRDMRRYRSPEQMLIREMLASLKKLRHQIVYDPSEQDLTRSEFDEMLSRADVAIRKAEASNV